ncbi:MAG: chorismate mutase [Gemmatimonadetes bacterium]|nr:chorismate mutase [Gemmatimonadota bacterium]MYF17820.1 chorismate mutase [Gemmatimonadota bacterium]
MDRNLDFWREKIDALDDQILELLNERARYALSVGKIKRAEGLPFHVPERETLILNRIRELNSGPLSHEAAQRIFRQIIDESLRLEEDHADSES